MNKKLLLRIEEIILLALILLNVFDFAEKISPEFDYIKKVISFVLMYYLLYKVSLSKQFFGVKNTDFDFLVIFGMFIIVIVRNFVSIAITAEPGFLSPFFNLLIENAQTFEIFSFYVGTLILLMLAFYAAFRMKIKKPSLLQVLHEKDSEPKWQKVFTNYLIFLAFFLLFFNLIFEWLTIAVDAPIISIALIAYLFLSIKKHHFDTESTLFKVGNFGEEFVEKFFSNFKYKEKLILGFVAMLILHLLTDIGIFIIPLFTGVHDPLYKLTVSNTMTLWTAAKSVTFVIKDAILYFLQYLLSAVGILILMLIPTTVWYSAYFKKKIYYNKFIIAFSYACMTALMFTPIFSLIPLKEYFYGVAIVLSPKITNIVISLSASLAVFLAVLFLYKYYYKFFVSGMLFFSSVFFCWYIIKFFLSAMNYLIGQIFMLVLSNYYYLAIHFFIFLMFILIFYLVGFWLYLRTVIKKVTI